MEIISASRRTDLPAFYAEWFMERVRAGTATYRNPFGGKSCQVSLQPDDVHSFVFWSKDFRPLLPHLPELDSRGYNSCFLFTITSLPQALEPAVCSPTVAVETLRQLARRYGSARVHWRYDPIVISAITDYIHHIRSFGRLCRALQGYTGRCYVSFVQMYGKTRRNLARLRPAVDCRLPAREQQRWLVAVLARLAAKSGITIHACCAEHLVGGAVQRGSCVDGKLLAELFPDRPALFSARPTRPGCGCTASRDIGAYDTCLHGCVYCYATASREIAVAHHRRVDLRSEELGASTLF